MVFKIKQMILWVAYRVDQWLPRGLGVCIRNRCWPWRPVLDAVELHLADRCNMNCTGCSHFSPFADEWYASVEDVGRDLRMLRAKFPGGIRHVNLLGGEPLLNRDVCAIIDRVKTECPEALVTVVTNGLVLLEQPPEFWEVCRRTGVRLNLTRYKPVVPKRGAIEERCRQERVPLRVQKGAEFFARMVPDGTVDVTAAFRFCRKTTYCPYLREGRLYRCAQAYHIRDFVRAVRDSGTEMSDVFDNGLDLRKTDLRGMGILRHLMTPGAVCRFCADRVRLMAWSNGSKDVRDWCLKRG